MGACELMFNDFDYNQVFREQQLELDHDGNNKDDQYWNVLLPHQSYPPSLNGNTTNRGILDRSLKKRNRDLTTRSTTTTIEETNHTTNNKTVVDDDDNKKTTLDE